MQKSTELHSPQSLRESCSRIRGILAGIEAAADLMEEKKIAAMDVDFQAAMQRAMKDLNRWSLGVQDALTEKLDSIGAFKAGPADPAKPRRRTAGKGGS